MPTFHLPRFIKPLLSAHKRRYRDSKRYRGGSWAALGAMLIASYPAATGIQNYQAANGEASFYLKVPESAGIDKVFTVELHVKSTSRSINAVSSVLEFSPRRLEVVTMTTSQSFCAFYTENSFNNATGRIEISCGAPSPGFTGDSTLILINMRARTPGQADVKMSPDEARILANDGKGTNLLRMIPSGSIVIKNQV